MQSIDFFAGYAQRLSKVLEGADWTRLAELSACLEACWDRKGQVFICGNGGSAGNAIHLANDFVYGVAKSSGKGIRFKALSDNPAVLTCLANDIGYENIFAEQLAVYADRDDLLIVLSGSGNSPNIVAALNKGNEIGMKTCAVLGYGGGKAKAIAAIPIHFNIDDMQISEDLQLVVGHMLMQWLYRKTH